MILLGESTLERKALESRAGQARRALVDAGFRSGDRLAAATGDDAELAVLFHACMGAGISLLPLDPDDAPGAARATVRAAGARGVIAPPHLELDGVAERTWRTSPRPRLVDRLLGRVAADGWPACTRALDPLPAEAHPEGREVLVLATSGTSSSPRLAAISFANLAAQTRTMWRELDLAPGARLLNCSPASHVDGVTGLFMAMHADLVLVRPGRFDVAAMHRITDAFYRHRVTHALLTPTHLRLILDLAAGPLADALEGGELRLLASTAEPLDAALQQAAERAFRVPVVDVYGMTEVGNVLFQERDPALRVPGTVGLPRDARVRVVVDGQPAADGTPGELEVSGPSVFLGYLAAPGAAPVPPGEWFATGDVAVSLPSGHVRIVGRKKAVVVSGGRNIHPEEVDSALRSHPAVGDCASVGVPDPVFGERLVTCVEGVPDEVADEELLEWLRARVASWKVPRRLVRMPALPRGRSGKVARASLAEAVAHPASAGGNLSARVLGQAARAFRQPVASLSLGTSAADCPGWDSMAHLDMVAGLEEEFDIVLSPEHVVQIRTLADAVRVVGLHRGDV